MHLGTYVTTLTRDADGKTHSVTRFKPPDFEREDAIYAEAKQHVFGDEDKEKPITR